MKIFRVVAEGISDVLHPEKRMMREARTRRAELAIQRSEEIEERARALRVRKESLRARQGR